MARLLANHAWLATALTALPLLCLAQERPYVMPLVPAANWRQVDLQPLPLLEVNKCGGDPVIEHEYGVKMMELRTYELGKAHLQVVVEPAPDPSAAYGLLTFYQTPAMAPEKGIQLAVSDASQTLMVRGNNFIRILHGQNSPPSPSDLQALLILVGGTKLPAGMAKDLPAPLPAKGKLPGSEKYLLGMEAAKRVLPSFRTDLIGFDQSAEVQLAQYQNGKSAATLLSIRYPTPQLARVRYGTLTHELRLNQDQGEDSIYGRRQGSYVFLVLNAGRAGIASALLDQFNVTETVSWDQKYVSERAFTLDFVHMILAIFLLTAILMGSCILVGVLFFLSRRFAAKFFPNSQWGHPDEDQLIRLNLKV